MVLARGGRTSSYFEETGWDKVDLHRDMRILSLAHAFHMI